MLEYASRVPSGSLRIPTRNVGVYPGAPGAPGDPDSPAAPGVPGDPDVPDIPGVILAGGGPYKPMTLYIYVYVLSL